MNKLALLLVAVLLIVVCIAIVNANEEQGREKLANRLKYSTTVELQIGADEEIENAVYSYVSRELRSLRDVRVVKDNGDWVINIVALIHHEGRLKRQVGFTLSTVVLNQFRLRPLIPLLFKGKLSEKASEYKLSEYKLLETFTSNLYRFIDHEVLCDGPNDLQHLCQKTVANFDARHLKPEREFRQEIIDEDIESLKKENPAIEQLSQTVTKHLPASSKDNLVGGALAKQKAASSNKTSTEGANTIFIGFPKKKVSEGGLDRVVEDLSRKKAVNFRCVISKIEDKYYWASRENVEMVKIERAGAFITFLAVNGSGYVRVIKPELKEAASLMSKTEESFDYVEHLTIGLRSVNYWGEKER